MAGEDSSIEPILPDASAQAKLETYMDMLQAWNRALNLTGMKDRSRIFSHLIYDSFYLAAFLQSMNAGLFTEDTLTVDLGSGAGLPGIPLRLVWEQGHYALVEIRQKRAIFLENVLAIFHIPNTRVYNLSAEEFLKSASSDIKTDKLHPVCIISRAFKPWPELLQFIQPYLPPHGCQIIMANQPAPVFPHPFHLLKQCSYKIEKSKRWLWAIGTSR